MKVFLSECGNVYDLPSWKFPFRNTNDQLVMAIKQKAKHTFNTAAMMLLYVIKMHRNKTCRRTFCEDDYHVKSVSVV
jgi:hypothetical protein